MWFGHCEHFSAPAAGRQVGGISHKSAGAAGVPAKKHQGSSEGSPRKGPTCRTLQWVLLESSATPTAAVCTHGSWALPELAGSPVHQGRDSYGPDSVNQKAPLNRDLLFPSIVLGRTSTHACVW